MSVKESFVAGFDSAEALIGYCEIHCETERALFSHDHINKMIQLAGHTDLAIVPEGFYSLHEPMKELCRRARRRLGGQQCLDLPEDN